jgi:hypothetical protein
MTVAQLTTENVVRPAEPPPLDTHGVEVLSDDDVAQLLVRRFRAFTERGLNWHEALFLALTPDT